MTLRAGEKIREGNFIKKSERNATPSNDNDKVPRLESDGFLSREFLTQLPFGDGSDGDVTISSPTTLTRDMFYNNLTVNSTLTTNGWRIYVKETINGSGTIDWGTPNNGGNGGASLTRGLGAAQSGAGPMKNASGGDGGGTSGGGTAQITGQLGLAGKTGGNGDGAAPTSNGLPGTSPTKEATMTLTTILWMLVQGVYQKTDGTFAFMTPCSAGGGGRTGNGGTTSTLGGGGGAGASGGIPFICAKIWSGTFTIKAVGGNGGNGWNGSNGDGGGGAGGNGGCPIVIFLQKLWTGSYLLTGGIGGTNGGGSGQAGPDGHDGTPYEFNAYNFIA